MSPTSISRLEYLIKTYEIALLLEKLFIEITRKKLKSIK